MIPRLTAAPTICAPGMGAIFSRTNASAGLSCRLANSKLAVPTDRRRRSPGNTTLSSLERSVRGLKALVPSRIRYWIREVYYPCFRALLLLRCRYADALRVRSANSPDRIPMPPALLRYRVSEDLDPALFLAVGERTSQDIQAAPLQANSQLLDFHSILDFGCGCGRTLTWLARQFPDAKFYGTDVDREAIDWCRSHLPLVEWQVNTALPPLAYGQSPFDLVYGISVFTHLDADHQER